jgi:hypothetical protein
MERGVVVGGLMICGSFLLAASLNRSAVKEKPVDEPPVAQAPIARIPIVPPAPAEHSADDAPETPGCATNAKDLVAPSTSNGPVQGELRGNGREACSQ